MKLLTVILSQIKRFGNLAIVAAEIPQTLVKMAAKIILKLGSDSMNTSLSSEIFLEGTKIAVVTLIDKEADIKNLFYQTCNHLVFLVYFQIYIHLRTY